MKTQSASLIPLCWNTNVQTSELVKTLKTLEASQISIQSFNVNHNKTVIANRYQIVEWVLFVSKNLNLKSETSFKAVQIFDLFLSKTKKPVNSIEELQFVAVVCLNLACKVEEVNCNYLNFMRANLMDKECSKADFVGKEIEILKTLNFSLSFPNFFDFNTIFVQIALNIMNKLQISVKVINKFLLANDLVLKNFAPMKECVFSSPLNSGLICFKTTILAFDYVMGGALANDAAFESAKAQIDQSIAVIFCEEYLKRCNVVAFNLFTALVKNKKVFAAENKLSATNKENVNVSNKETVSGLTKEVSE